MMLRKQIDNNELQDLRNQIRELKEEMQKLKRLVKHSKLEFSDYLIDPISQRNSLNKNNETKALKQVANILFSHGSKIGSFGNF